MDILVALLEWAEWIIKKEDCLPMADGSSKNTNPVATKAAGFFCNNYHIYPNFIK